MGDQLDATNYGYPFSGALDRTLLHMVFASRPCAHGLLPGFPKLQPAHPVLKTTCSNIRSSAPENGHNGA